MWPCPAIQYVTEGIIAVLVAKPVGNHIGEYTVGRNQWQQQSYFVHTRPKLWNVRLIEWKWKCVRTVCAVQTVLGCCGCGFHLFISQLEHINFYYFSIFFFSFSTLFRQQSVSRSACECRSSIRSLTETRPATATVRMWIRCVSNGKIKWLNEGEIRLHFLHGPTSERKIATARKQKRSSYLSFRPHTGRGSRRMAHTHNPKLNYFDWMKW